MVRIFDERYWKRSRKRPSHRPMDLSKLLPRDCLGRIALIISGVFFAPLMLGAALMVLDSIPGKKVWETICLAAAADVLLGLALFFLCGLVWAIFTPRWIERV